MTKPTVTTCPRCHEHSCICGKTFSAKVDRPVVSVSALTANTCEVLIDTDHGTVRLVCSQDRIEIDAKGTKIEVKP